MKEIQKSQAQQVTGGVSSPLSPGPYPGDDPAFPPTPASNDPGTMPANPEPQVIAPVGRA